jgi:triphosphoribosyl-dephospho-CoA synthase
MFRHTDARAMFLRACALDVETMKPGNVSHASAGHGMSAAQFIASADAAADGLFEHGARVGQRILNAVRATFDAVGCNTNLGIVLLCAPLCAALERENDLQTATHDVLMQLNIEDARLAYEAIALANPGGLGDAPEQSVHTQPSVDLLAAMTLAADRDSIARQYANGFADVFAVAHRIETSNKSAHEIMLDAYLTFLTQWPDSHIVRKHGAAMAQSVTQEAIALTDARDAASLIEWDTHLKARGINPGTSADLSVAAMFAALMLHDSRRDRTRNWHGTC